MLYIMIGGLAFFAFIGFDIASLNEKCYSKYLLGVLGLVLLFSNSLLMVLQEQPLAINTWIRLIASMLTIVFLFLLIYSVFIEVGKNTYESNAKPKLVTSGTYSLSRHPGVIWFFFFYFFLAIAFESRLLLWASLTWSVLNALYTFIQEKYVLYKLFVNYKEYKNTTPMFIPNITSIRKFITTENWRKE